MERAWRGLTSLEGLTSGEKTLAGAGLPFVLENSTQSTWPTLTSCLLFCAEEKIICDFVLFSEADISTSFSGPNPYLYPDPEHWLYETGLGYF